MQIHHYLNFADAIAGQQIAAVGIGPDADLILLVIDPSDSSAAFGRYVSPAGASFPHASTPRTYPASVLHWKNGSFRRVDIAALDVAHPKIQPMADGGILIVASRCNFNSGAPDKNAALYDSQGRLVRRWVFGDGIQDVQVSRDQRIWVSYFDEGIFGNRGWNTPLGSTGLQCFDTEGETLWRFEPPAGFDQICDCYAMNVADDGVWACYYTDFPIVHISKNLETQGWSNNIDGARAIAVTRRKALLWGGYSTNRKRCVVQSFGNDYMTSSQELDFTLPGDTPSPITHTIGRASTLHFIAGMSWYQFDLHTLS
ncbi:hypothetical protein CCAX7_63590 [Capsulimonas corticalis]|uniref:Uncharacterized protein n=1 Tax=Capsulimonas corticalis TaxID=2219043 RepID=A0A402CWZ0_9BACT|nr:hypothetical protein [Capsulimonas corticalis]BDI34308.1 hypothetical protein CCAX7_63590 [Capsulimonas corticalis]